MFAAEALFVALNADGRFHHGGAGDVVERLFAGAGIEAADRAAALFFKRFVDGDGINFFNHRLSFLFCGVSRADSARMRAVSGFITSSGR